MWTRILSRLGSSLRINLLAIFTALAALGAFAPHEAQAQTKWRPLCIPDVNGQCGNTLNITIQASTNNVYLPTLMSANGWNGTSAAKVKVTILSGVVVGSTSNANPAFDTGTLPAGSTIKITNNGMILGKGGNAPGGNGGPALKVQYATEIVNNYIIGGGGGGGGYGAFIRRTWVGSCDPYGCMSWEYDTSGGGGGGGAGAPVGSGGGTNGGSNFCGGNWYGPSGGSNGSNTAGGGGGSGTPNPCPYGGGAVGGYGGSGGGLGQPGAAGASSGTEYAPATSRVTVSAASAGGAPGACTTPGSNAFITWTTPGTRYGAIQ